MNSWRRLQPIRSIAELLKHDVPYPVAPVTILFERSAWRKLSGYLWRNS
jgi:hypothetical protein